MSGLERHELRLHGQRVAYYTAGSGPLVLLIHGITSSADAWRRVIPALGGHGVSAMAHVLARRSRSPGWTGRNAVRQRQRDARISGGSTP